MTKRALVFVFVMSASLAFGQLDSNSITVTASRNATLQPDQVVFSVDVFSGLDTSLDDILAALAGSGISTANFVGVSTVAQFVQTGRPSAFQPNLDWSFTLPVPWSRMKDTIAMLTALQKTIALKNSALTMSFSVQGTQVSPQLLQSQVCSVSDLLSDARAQAQKLANAANLFLGVVLAMSSMTSSNAGSSGPLVLSYVSSTGCSLTVEFAVTR